MANIITAYFVMAHIVMAYIVMVHIVMVSMVGRLHLVSRALDMCIHMCTARFIDICSDICAGMLHPISRSKNSQIKKDS